MAERTRGSGSQHNGGSKYVAERSHSQTLWHRATNYPGTHGYLCFLRIGCGGFGSRRARLASLCLVEPRTDAQRTGSNTSPDQSPNPCEFLLSHPAASRCKSGKGLETTLAALLRVIGGRSEHVRSERQPGAFRRQDV